MKEPKLITYTNLLHEHGGPSAKAAKNFVEKHQDDIVFVRRAETLNNLFNLRDAITGLEDSIGKLKNPPVFHYVAMTVGWTLGWVVGTICYWWWIEPYLQK